MVESITTRCCIAGAGPAGMMLGLVLARAGIDVVVLEKHADFFRDFRGDTIHPSTVTLLGELGLRERFLALPHTSIRTLDVVVNGTRLHPIDFGHLRPPDDVLVLAPQWGCLRFLAGEPGRSPGFQRLLRPRAVHLIQSGCAVGRMTAG